MNFNRYLKYVIVQAGGKGTRMRYLTFNKPKCLISVFNRPLLFYLFDAFKQAKFFIIADYKKEVLKKYLNIYASKVNYEVIETQGKGTLSGIKEAVSQIPRKTPFVITWSDLLFKGNPIPEEMELKYNYVGLSKLFTCRWSFRNGKFFERKSKKYGVAGFFLFCDKNQLRDLPTEGEFVRYLRDKKINFKGFDLVNTYEVGTLAKYLKLINNSPAVRPFNAIKVENNRVIKMPQDEKGEKLMKYERGFYKKAVGSNFKFFPKILSFKPLILKRVFGKPLYFYRDIPRGEKKKILKQIVDNLKTIHYSLSPVSADRRNDYEAIVGKTLRRVNEIIDLIPHRDSEFVFINGKRCINFIRKWGQLEKFMDKFYPTTYTLIHGDLTFSNTLLSRSKKVYFIDPRGYYGKIKLFGDPDYDWAKVYYSLVGNYDQFNLKNFILKISGNSVELKIKSNGWEKLEKFFFNLTEAKRDKILLYHGIIWLSFTTYAWDNVDSILGAFYNGIYWLNIFYEQYKKTF